MPVPWRQCLSSKPLLVVISGPSGVGKDVLLARMKELGRSYHFTVTATTRPKRPNERDGVDYHFLSPERFQAMVQAGEFLEWAQVYGHYYGVPRQQVREALAGGKDVLIKADVQGAATIKRLAPQALLVFLAPSSLEELEQRLHQRKTESPEAMALRIKTAHQEMECLPLFEYMVVNANGRLDDAVAAVDAILRAEKCRIPHRAVEV
ncbi:MAG: guanylate kinase [Chloroflexi bacterium]|nr:guanylate kinase [Chloroflexota bacterium]